MSTIDHLLFVCAGNICRSPMAEALLGYVAKSRPARGTLEVGSAGTIALSGNLPSADAIDVMRREFGLEIAAHRARLLTRRLRADLILALDRETEREAQALKLRAPVRDAGRLRGDGRGGQGSVWTIPPSLS